MAKRTVVWTQTALKQRREIFKYWTKRNHSTVYAEKLIKLTANRLKVIIQNPESYKNVNFPDTRISSIGHFSIVYKITNKNIIVTSFWDNRQNPAELLKILKINNL